jgi:hypothetical protein
MSNFTPGFVENMGGFVCSHCGETSHIFGDEARDWARAKSVTFLGSVPLEKDIMVKNYLIVFLFIFSHLSIFVRFAISQWEIAKRPPLRF